MWFPFTRLLVYHHRWNNRDARSSIQLNKLLRDFLLIYHTAIMDYWQHDLLLAGTTGTMAHCQGRLTAYCCQGPRTAWLTASWATDSMAHCCQGPRTAWLTASRTTDSMAYCCQGRLTVWLTAVRDDWPPSSQMSWTIDSMAYWYRGRLTAWPTLSWPTVSMAHCCRGRLTAWLTDVVDD